MNDLKKITKVAILSVFIGTTFSLSAYAAGFKAGTVNVQTVLNLRAKPSASAALVSQLKNGEKILVENSEQSGWLKAYGPSGFGYVSADYVNTAASGQADYCSGIITGSVVNIRKAPGTENEIIGKLCADAKVKITGIDGEWLKISHDSSVGYVHGDYIKPCSAESGNSGSSAAAPSSKASSLISYANGYLGVPYVRGGSSPKGFDCSGFTQYVFKKFGVTLPRTAASQAGSCASVARDSLKSGDLVFFRSPSTTKIAHVGIYIDGGRFIHSSSPGDVVKTDTLTSGYYDKYYVCAGRVSF